MNLLPVKAKIIELPDYINESFENLIFIGLWLDNMKPNSEVYVSKCVETICNGGPILSFSLKGKYLMISFFLNFYQWVI